MANKLGLDLKEEFNKNEEIYSVEEKNAIVRFMMYKQSKLNIDCDRADKNQMSGQLYLKLWLNDEQQLKDIDGDIMNSFWTTWRRVLELCFEEYFIKNRVGISIQEEKLKYQFVLLFGGLRRQFNPICGVTKQNLIYHFQNTANNENIDVFIQTLLKKKEYSDKAYNEVKYRWIIQNIEMIAEIIIEVAGQDFYNLLEEFALLIHTKGNLIATFKGYNQGRSLVTLDYMDLTLKTIRSVLGENVFKDYVRRFFLEDYIDSDGNIKMFWEGHEFNRKQATNLREIRSFLEIVNQNIIKREKRMNDALHQKGDN